MTRGAPSTAPERPTDWDRYYASVPVTARFTRPYTMKAVMAAVDRFVKPMADQRPVGVVEVGGGNSTFLGPILEAVRCARYDVVDTNQFGLSLIAERLRASNSPVHLHHRSVLDMQLPPVSDFVFSLGLIEHFDVAGTSRAIAAHFGVLRPGGIALISFPTPTLLYRATRGVIEAANRWEFHDERPLPREEVRSEIRRHGSILHEQTLWPLMLTQHLIVARKSQAGDIER